MDMPCRARGQGRVGRTTHTDMNTQHTTTTCNKKGTPVPSSAHDYLTCFPPRWWTGYARTPSAMVPTSTSAAPGSTLVEKNIHRGGETGQPERRPCLTRATHISARGPLKGRPARAQPPRATKIVVLLCSGLSPLYYTTILLTHSGGPHAQTGCVLRGPAERAGQTRRYKVSMGCCWWGERTRPEAAAGRKHSLTAPPAPPAWRART